MSARTDAVRLAAEDSQDELARHFQAQIDALRAETAARPQQTGPEQLGPELRSSLLAELRASIPTIPSTPSALDADLKRELQAELHEGLRNALRDELRSDLQAGLQEGLRAALRDELRAELLADLHEGLRTTLGDELQPALFERLRTTLGDTLQPRLQQGLHEALRAELQPELHEGLRLALHGELKDRLQAELHDGLREGLRATLRDEIKQELQPELHEGLRTTLRDELHEGLRGTLRDELQPQLHQGLHEALRAELQPELHEGLRSTLRDELRSELHQGLHEALRAELQPELHEGLRTTLRDELKQQLQTELHVVLRDQIRTELQSELRAELQGELRAELLSEREKVGQRLNAVDAQTSAFGQKLADATAALNRRVDETGRALEGQMDEHVLALTRSMGEMAEATRLTAAEQLSIVSRKVDENDQRSVDRMLSMEERISAHMGTRLADLDANVGRMGRGIDEAIEAMSHRLAEAESANLGIVERLEQLAIDVGKVDEEALERLREQMSSAVGESMLVRIEMERLGVSTSEQIDRVNVRIGELATLVADTTMDVSTAVQLERLEEIERALIELDPDQFVRKDGSTAPARPRVDAEDQSMSYPTYSEATTFDSQREDASADVWDSEEPQSDELFLVEPVADDTESDTDAIATNEDSAPSTPEASTEAQPDALNLDALVEAIRWIEPAEGELESDVQFKRPLDQGPVTDRPVPHLPGSSGPSHSWAEARADSEPTGEDETANATPGRESEAAEPSESIHPPSATAAHVDEYSSHSTLSSW